MPSCYSNISPTEWEIQCALECILLTFGFSPAAKIDRVLLLSCISLALDIMNSLSTI